jgi:hypothetical protein
MKWFKRKPKEEPATVAMQGHEVHVTANPNPVRNDARIERIRLKMAELEEAGQTCTVRYAELSLELKKRLIHTEVI